MPLLLKNKLTVALASPTPSSNVPVNTVNVGEDGNTASIVAFAGSDTLPAASVCVTAITTPSSNGVEVVKLQSPFSSAVTVSSKVPSLLRSILITASASPVPAIKSAVRVVTTGSSGITASMTCDTGSDSVPVRSVWVMDTVCPSPIAGLGT